MRKVRTDQLWCALRSSAHHVCIVRTSSNFNTAAQLGMHTALGRNNKYFQGFGIIYEPLVGVIDGRVTTYCMLYADMN